jgi:sirohydrochlorin ferrochelatase
MPGHVRADDSDVDANARIERLLEELRDTQREHLAEYRRVTQQSLELQKRAVSRQEEIGALYRRMVLIGAPVATGLLVLLIYLLVRWWGYLFR